MPCLPFQAVKYNAYMQCDSCITALFINLFILFYFYLFILFFLFFLFIYLFIYLFILFIYFFFYFFYLFFYFFFFFFFTCSVYIVEHVGICTRDMFGVKHHTGSDMQYIQLHSITCIGMLYNT